MKIRRIEARDNQQLFQLIRQILEAEGLNLPGTAYFDENLKQLSLFYKEEASDYFVVDNEDGTIAGGAGFSGLSNDICELQKLYLLPDYRGLGYANQLMKMVLEEAKKNYRQIYLETHTDLSSAMKLYEKFGFQHLSAPLEETEHSLMNRWLIKDLTV